MVYRAIGLMSGSSLDGLDIVLAAFHENAGLWNYEIIGADCIPYSKDWVERLRKATQLSALDYLLLDAEYGHYLGTKVNEFIEAHHVQYQVALVASHGHTTFHAPSKKMTAQLGNGASIAAETRLPVVTDLRAVDVALGGQGAPIVPIGEKLLLGDHDYFLNLGGIANLSLKGESTYIAYDVCPANRVLNLLANEIDKEYDANGSIAASGSINKELLDRLNNLEYYRQPFPKSLANDFGTDQVYPMIKDARCEVKDGLRTYTEHIVIQISNAIANLKIRISRTNQEGNQKLLVTGGGAFNDFLIERLRQELQKHKVDVIVPESQLINFKEALIMAFIGVLRWRQEYNVLSSVTGAARDSIGGAIWTGEEA